MEQIIGDVDVCHEALQNIIEKLSLFVKCLTKHHTSVPIYAEKTYFLLDIYTSTCQKIRVLHDSSSNKIKLEDSKEDHNISELWMKRWFGEEGIAADSAPVYDHDINLLERLMITVHDKYHMIYLQAAQSLEAVKSLLT